MKFFDPQFFKFLKEIKHNNNREWFLHNKTRYEKRVKEPLLEFVAALRPKLLNICDSLKVDPKPNGGSMLRIYRDTRFSKDKTPYKTNAAAHFPYQSPDPDIHTPGFYLHLEPGASFMGAGIWHPDPVALQSIREAIVKRPVQWEAFLKSKLSLEGESLKKPPRGFDPDHPLVKDLKRKDFIVTIDFSDKQVCSDRFLNDYIQACKKAEPLMKFLVESLGFKWK